MPRPLTRTAGPTATRAVDGPVRVLEWPPWLNTNYLPKVVDTLRAEGFEVSTPRVLGSGSARLRSGDWLHVHWSTEAHIHRFRWLYRARAALFSRRMRALKRRGVRIAWTAHNLVPHDDPYPELGHRFRNELLAHADHVFVHFPGAAATLTQEFGYTGPCTVIHHPHYVDRHPVPPPRATARAELGLPADGFVALSFGMIRPYKGTADIIRAFGQMAGEHDRLVLAGSPRGDVSAELAPCAEDPRIILHAWRIPDADVSTYFAAADVAVVAHHEFFTSGSALLSLSMGCPLVGPAIHHLAHLAGGRRLFPSGPGVDGLAEALVAARDSAHEIDREALRTWSTGHGSWRDLGSRTAAVFRDRSSESARPR